MLIAERRPTGIVVEEADILAPSEPHVELARQQDADRDLERLWPTLHRSERRVGPVLRTHQRRYLAAADEKVRMSMGLRQSMVLQGEL